MYQVLNVHLTIINLLIALKDIVNSNHDFMSSLALQETGYERPRSKRGSSPPVPAVRTKMHSEGVSFVFILCHLNPPKRDRDNFKYIEKIECNSHAGNQFLH